MTAILVRFEWHDDGPRSGTGALIYRPILAAQRPIRATRSIRDIIRVWGVLNGYRPKGQTRWSKALVRAGADARAAIAAVLVVPAGDLVTREHDKH